MKLTERQRVLLKWLKEMTARNSGSRVCDNGLHWATPMQLGGTDASHHSNTLQQLIRKGLAVRKKLPIGIFGKSYGYRSTEPKASDHEQ